MPERGQGSIRKLRNGESSRRNPASLQQKQMREGPILTPCKRGKTTAAPTLPERLGMQRFSRDCARARQSDCTVLSVARSQALCHYFHLFGSIECSSACEFLITAPAVGRADGEVNLPSQSDDDRIRKRDCDRVAVKPGGPITTARPLTRPRPDFTCSGLTWNSPNRG